MIIKKLNYRIVLPGFTLAELLTAVVVFVAITIMAVAVYINVFAANRKANADRIVIDETTYLVEKIVKDIRNGNIDYPGYYRWARNSYDYTVVPDPDDTKQNYLEYEGQTPGYIAPDVPGNTPPMSAVTGVEDCTADSCTPPNGVYPGLMILSSDGSTRTIFQLYENDRDGNPTTDKQGEIVMYRERLIEANDGNWYWIDADVKDEANGGSCDYTAPDLDSDCDVVENVISSHRIDVTDFSFTISPARDPFLAYDDISVQQQPMIRLSVTAEPSVDFPAGPGSPIPISITTSISIRTYGEALWVPFEDL
jgi:hypothetical protein